MTDGQVTGFWVGYVVVGIVALIVHIWLSHAIGKAAERRNRSYWAFFWLSFFVSWIIMGIIVATLPNSSKSEESIPGHDSHDTGAAGTSGVQISSPRLVKCPLCAEEIKAEAVLCRYCKSDISDSVKQREGQVAAQLATAQAEEQANQEAESRARNSPRLQWRSRLHIAGKVPDEVLIEEVTDEGLLVLFVRSGEKPFLSKKVLKYLYRLELDVFGIHWFEMSLPLADELYNGMRAGEDVVITHSKGGVILNVAVETIQGSTQYRISISPGPAYFL
jgi:hypothetical protein